VKIYVNFYLNKIKMNKINIKTILRFDECFLGCQDPKREQFYIRLLFKKVNLHLKIFKRKKRQNEKEIHFPRRACGVAVVSSTATVKCCNLTVYNNFVNRITIIIECGTISSNSSLFCLRVRKYALLKHLNILKYLF